MKKMEEFMELLTEELACFDRSVEKLEQLSKNLNNVKVKADSSQIDYRIKEFLNKQRQDVKSFKKQTNKMETKLDSMQILPKWLLVLYGIALLLPLFAISYFGYQGFRLQEIKKNAFNHGQDHIIEHFKKYFDENPEAYGPYKNWKEKDSEIPIAH